MFSQQAKTYLVYNRGLMPDDLTLGSLHLDPTNPIDDERKCFYNDMPVDPKWLRTPQIDTPCSFSINASRDWLAQAGLLNLIKAEAGYAKSADVTVSGKSGRRLQIKSPETYLNDVILTSSSAQSWLQRILTLRSRMQLTSRLRKVFGKPPKIWMVTGLQYVEEATVSSVDKERKSIAGYASIPPPDPTLVAAMANIPSISGEISVGHSQNTTLDYGHKDERIWAAQFRSLRVDYILVSDQEQQSKITNPTWIMLQTAPHMGYQGIRAEDNDEEWGDICDDQREFANLAGIDDVTTGDDKEQRASMLHSMLDVDWTLLDEMLIQE